MFKNYVRTALRALRKHPGYNALNIGGLALGLACAIVIGLSVHHDLSFDRMHADGDRIYRVNTIDAALGVSSQQVGIAMPALAPTLEAEVPEVERATRLLANGRILIGTGDRALYADDTFLAEPSFFDVFSFPLVRGDAEAALAEPYSVVLSETLARALFGEADPLGATVRIDDANDATVTGIVADPPATSHLRFDAVLAMSPPEDQPGFAQFLTSWNSISMIAYVRLRPGADAGAVAAKLEPLIRAHEVRDNFSLTLQPLHDLHLGSTDVLYDTNAGKSDRGYVYALAAVAGIVLLIAAFNFMNLATARSAERAREIGVRKVVGADRRQLVLQHLGESLLTCLIAFVVALVLAAAALPWAGLWFGKELSLAAFADPVLVLVLLAVGGVVTLVAGAYPAFVLSRLEPVRVLKGRFVSGAGGRLLRQTLVVAQFAASIVLIVGALVVARQLDYIMTRDMGYDREQVLLIDLANQQLQANGDALAQELRRHPAVVDVARSGSVPGRVLGRTRVLPEGTSEDDTWITSVLGVDDGFLRTLGVEFAAGRAFDRARPADAQGAVIINEAAAAAMGWDAPVGRTITVGGGPREVVGVVKDFHFASVRHRVEPLVMLPLPEGGGSVLAVRLQGQEAAAVLDHAEAAWMRLNPAYPFEHAFLDDEFAQQYREEAHFARLARAFTVLAVLIACLGLFGLAAFSAAQRTKEVGVRKVLGASTGGLTLLLTRDFARLVLVAVVLAVPVAYLLMSRWLDGFAYRIDLGPGLFVVAAVLALGVAVLTVGYQALRAALADPIRSLRYE